MRTINMKIAFLIAAAMMLTACATLKSPYYPGEKVAFPNLWHPRKDNYFQIDEMPALGTGKLDMKQLKTIAAERVETKGHRT